MSYASKNSNSASNDYSDAESQSQEKPALKRQRIAFDQTIPTEMNAATYNPKGNTHLRGRKRFSADLSDIREACATGLAFHGLKIKSSLFHCITLFILELNMIGIRPGDDDGSIEVVLENGWSEHVISINLLISDTSEYPGSHSLFCYSPDADIPSKFQKVVDGVADGPPRSIGETVDALMFSVAKVMAPVAKTSVNEDASEDEDSADDYDAYDDYDDMASAPVEQHSIMAKLQENFVDIVATEYRPGFIRLGGNDFLVSVSLPVITLSESIPPRALMAWDRRLLSYPQHLTLLITGFRGLYPVLEPDASYTSGAQRLGVGVTFKVGLSHKYKPGTEQAQEVVRKHGLILQDAEDELRIQAESAAQQQKMYDWEEEYNEDEPMGDAVQEEEVEEEVDEGRFDRFSLSSSLESLMDQSFLRIVQIRRKFNLGWAGAEFLHNEVEKSQLPDEQIYKTKRDGIRQADADERELARTTALPHDPLIGINRDEPFNLPLTAFCYLVRRLSLCTRYCIVCHNKLHFDYEALKPYVCDSKLCTYQYYSLNRGPSLEYEIIHNPLTVDLLVSLAYVSASEGAMDDPLPVGLGLRVPHPLSLSVVEQTRSETLSFGMVVPGPVPVAPVDSRLPAAGPDGLVEFDELDLPQMRSCIARLINSLPSIADMKKHLGRKVKIGKSKPKLKDVNPDVLPAAWSILRWCVASCTAHIEAIDSGEELIKNLDPTWRQFRLSVGAPDAEAKFKGAIEEATRTDSNARNYPVIYAFHGSPLKNWHSIIRHGLWYRTVAHGRAYGDGVYLAKDAVTSMGYNGQTTRFSWQQSETGPTNCMALTEVVNLPSKFVSHNPHYVIKDTHWIMCRYLLVKGVADPNELIGNMESKAKKGSSRPYGEVPFVRLDPKNHATVSNKPIEIPDPAFQVESLLAERKEDFIREDPDEEDLAIFHLNSSKPIRASQQEEVNHDLDDEDDYHIPVASSSKPKAPVKRPANDWKHDEAWVISTLENQMLPPFESTPYASMAIQRELKAMLKEQESVPCLKDLGWYMPPDLIADNLYQWIVEMHSLDPALPIAKDLKAKKVNSIIFEIRFPPTFPNSPPYFRIISPRFLPFIHGGGGHVTGGGSICMDLLTSDGWLPSYSISAVMMQIRMAIGNLEPRPARLSNDWTRPYGVEESLQGYKRAAATHGWTLPPGLDRLVR
ncbi:hypothetical protein B0H34DRAFT_727589 [Crassisporium funariophilum]|nr:hypothetical protein B0H34DRAFT_727589 [Crassisporium funariophilum]